VYYENESEKVEIDNNIILKLRMGLSDKKLETLVTPNYTIVSYIMDFKKEKANHQSITGVILKPTDNPNNFRNQIKIASENLTKIINSSNVEINNQLKSVYDELFETPTVLLNQTELETRLKDRVKQLTKEGKFDQAKEMLDLIKKVPKKLFEANKNAEKAIEVNDLDTAERELKKAQKFAEDLGEYEQAKLLSERAKIVKQIPKLEEARKDEVKKAKESLRKDDFHEAYVHFKNAADLSKKLMDSRGTEEYTLKADALAKFAEINKRFGG
jgi:hypothetical protein